MSDRIHCIVPFCGRTSPRSKHPESNEIICGKCWRGYVSRAAKAERTRLKRRWRRIERIVMRHKARRRDVAPQMERIAGLIDRLWQRNWERCKREAINKI